MVLKSKGKSKRRKKQRTEQRTEKEDKFEGFFVRHNKSMKSLYYNRKRVKNISTCNTNCKKIMIIVYRW